MEKIVQKLNEMQVVARTIYGRTFDFHVVMNGRLTTTAGRAFLESGKLEFSPSLYAANQEDFIADTVVHEFAHLVAYQLAGDKGHGQAWKQVMIAFGVNPTRCHSYEVPKRAKSNTTQFKCACMTHEFTPQRMAWVRKGKVYKCKHCAEILKEVK
jgi:SprT protein